MITTDTTTPVTTYGKKVDKAVDTKFLENPARFTPNLQKRGLGTNLERLERALGDE